MYFSLPFPNKKSSFIVLLVVSGEASEAMFTAAFILSEVTLEGDVLLDADIIFFSALIQ